MYVSSKAGAVKQRRAHKAHQRTAIRPKPEFVRSALLKAANLWFRSLKTPFSMEMAELVLTDHDALLARGRSWDRSAYDHTEAFRTDYLVASLLKKANFLSTKYDATARKDRCIDKWVEAETQCAKANDRLRQVTYQTLPHDVSLLATLSKAREFIAKVLGRAPRWEDLDCRFGPGSTYLVKNQIVTPKKYGRKAVCTPNLLPYIERIRGFHWPTNDVLVVDGNSLSTVPKDATIDRPIGIEPDMNVYVQLGLGSAIRSRLKPWIDLDTGQDVNRRLASVAHHHRLSTIDLASASDTVCYMLVMLLLPEDWFDMLDACRSPCTTYNGQTVTLDKFSSMGNGYTFELETLIFYALCRASGSNAFWTVAYGDDLIVDRDSFDNVVMTLEACGFTVNREKSFKEGDFFESCGEDYYRGVNVRPVFWKTAESVVDLLKAVNDVSRWSTVGNDFWSYRQNTGLPAWTLLVFKLQSIEVTNRVPRNAGDVGIISPFDEACPTVRGAGLEGFTFKVVKYESRTLDTRHWYSSYLYSLDRGVKSDVTVIEGAKVLEGDTRWGLTRRGGAACLPVRDDGEYYMSVGHSHEWPFLGPWM